MTMPTTIQPLWDALQHEVINIHAYWINYRQLFGKSAERLNLLNECAGNFFFIIHDALLTNVQLSLCRLAGPAETFGKTNATLDTLLNEIGVLHVPSLTAQLTHRVQAYSACCENIKLRRNKELAHADLGALLQRHGCGDGLSPIPGPLRQEIEDALAALRAFMNVVDGHFIGSPMAYEHFFSVDDGEALVDILKQGLRYRELTDAQQLPFDDLKRLSHYDA
jgi:hypothetical protein